MSATTLNEVRKGFYLDSVALMRMSRTIASSEGVEEAAMMMGTPANREIMAAAGLLDDPGEPAGGGDLIIGVRAVSRELAEAALDVARAQLDQPQHKHDVNAVWRPRSLRAALKQAPGSSLALISVPGDFAVAEARKAIRRGLHAMIFSDNVDIAEEVELKREARELGCLVMGPDCGTAIINGTPLAFANKVPRGATGIVGASGTGIQEVSSLIAQYGGGISHAIGVGGRDLKAEVGGISTMMAIDALASDSSTAHIVVISKPPPEDVARQVLDCIAAAAKPATICFIGADAMTMPDNARQVFTLKAAAQHATDLTHQDVVPPAPVTAPGNGGRRILGLYSGGTLCAETQVLFRAAGQVPESNAPIPGVPELTGDDSVHTILDLGDDQYTRGQPHPMIDPAVRDDLFTAALGDSSVGVILVDVVIGYGAHGDPAGHLAGLLDPDHAANRPVVIASVTGTDADPQIRSAQVAKLRTAGIHVAPTNADAASWALCAVQGRSREDGGYGTG